MSRDKLHNLCEQIPKETDPKKLVGLLAKLRELLQEEQDRIQATINENLNGKVHT